MRLILSISGNGDTAIERENLETSAGDRLPMAASFARGRGLQAVRGMRKQGCMSDCPAIGQGGVGSNPPVRLWRELADSGRSAFWRKAAFSRHLHGPMYLISC